MTRTAYPPGSVVDQIVIDLRFEKALDSLSAMKKLGAFRTIPRHNDVGYELYLDDQAQKAVRRARIR